MRLLRSEFDVDTRYGGRFVQAIDGLRATARAVSATGSSGSTVSRGASARPSTSSRRATASSGTTATGAPPCACRRSSARSPSRSCTGSRASGGRCGSSAMTPSPRLAVTLGRCSRRPAPLPPAPRWARPGPRRSPGSSWPAGRRRGSSAARPGSRRDPRRPACSPASTARVARSSCSTSRARSRARSGPGDGVGLVLALRPLEEELVWLATGLDDEGVAAAARALTEEDLRDAFAVAVQGRTVEKLPLVSQ